MGELLTTKGIKLKNMLTKNVIDLATEWAIKLNAKEWANHEVREDKSGQVDIIKENNKVYVRHVIKTPLGDSDIFFKEHVIDKKKLNI